MKELKRYRNNLPLKQQEINFIIIMEMINIFDIDNNIISRLNI
jgi:hypothetical protein